MDRFERCFYAAIGLVALRIVDDTFLQPAAGTEATDHLASGLIPLAVLVAGALAFRRSGAVARGFVAILTGIAGLVTGADAFYYAAESGLASDQLTGFAAFAAGVFLVGLGTTILWSGRRLDRSLGRRYGMRALLALAAALVFSSIVFPAAIGYLMTHIQAVDVPAPNLGTTPHEVTLRTSDGLELDAWYVPSRNRAAVIVFPGRRESTQSRARMLIEHGYGVLLMDRRGEGASEGQPNAFGWGGYRDIGAGVDFLRARPEVDDDRIAGIGLSVGGEMLIELAAEPDDGLAAVISEGAGTRSWAEEKETSDGGLLGAPSLILKTASVALFSDTAPPPSMFDLIPAVAPTPLFLISSREAPNEVLAPGYEQIAGAGSESWSIPGNHHIGGIDVAPELYERRVVGFLDRSLGSERGSEAEEEVQGADQGPPLMSGPRRARKLQSRSKTN
jgi:uncharacterized protein